MRTTTKRAAGGYLPGMPVDGRLRLFCFHHAGGSAGAFGSWQAGLGAEVSVLPVQLPGREGRIDEPRFRDLDTLVTDLRAHLGDYLRLPYAFYGHSMGALVAYALARRTVELGDPAPAVLLVGAYPAPDLPALLSHALQMTDRELGQLLVQMGGMSPMLIDYPDWLRAATATVRDDLRVCVSRRYTDGGTVPCPIRVFRGVSDELMSAADAQRWERHTSAGCTVTAIPGGHFFPSDSLQRFLTELRAALPLT